MPSILTAGTGKQKLERNLDANEPTAVNQETEKIIFAFSGSAKRRKVDDPFERTITACNPDPQWYTRIGFILQKGVTATEVA